MVNLEKLVYPLFVKDGFGIREEIPSMPGIHRFSSDELLKEIEELKSIGISNILLFGIADEKDNEASGAYKSGNVIENAILLIKNNFPTLTVMTDVCLCAYTLSGHCAILKPGYSEDVDNEFIDLDKSLSVLSKIALSHAKAGADYVAPSAVLKGQVGTIRNTLNKNGYINTKIMGYSAKFASSFYGPFRDAALSAPKFGNRNGYQLDFAKTKPALEKIESDLKEGADIVMVKPALGYLDIIKEAKNTFKHPLAAYNVSGEYAMVKSGAQSGWWDEKKMVYEIISAIKRTGADIIITYHARDIARWQKGHTKWQKKSVTKKILNY